MKKKNAHITIAIVLAVIYLSFATIFFVVGIKFLQDRYFKVLGQKAVDFAALTSNALKLTDAEVLELESIKFSELNENETNKNLQSLFKDVSMGNDEVSNIYMYKVLQPDEYKYFVADEDKEKYDLPVGTPLNTVYLLDIYLGWHPFETDPSYFEDKNRYEYAYEFIENIFNEKKATYQFVNDYMGEHVSGFAPIYTVEGSYAGIIGVDIKFSKILGYRRQTTIALLFTFILPTALFIILFTINGIKYSRLLKTVSFTDALTGMYNRTYYDHIYPLLVKEARRNRQPLSIILLDIDFFKSYNDTYGHQKGDKCISDIASAIRSACKRAFDIVIRYGGEEILILLKNTDTYGAVRIAKNIAENVSELNIEHKGSKVKDTVTVSQGVFTVIPDTNEDYAISKYIENADKALYMSKRGGRNRYTVWGDEVFFGHENSQLNDNKHS